MSGRVGDLSPKQEEALVKVSLSLARPPPRAVALSLRRQRAGKGLGGGRVTVSAGGRRRHLEARGPPVLPPPAVGARGSLGTPAPAPSELLEVPPGKKWLLGSPWRQLRAQRRHSFRDWQPGPGSRAPGFLPFPGGFPFAEAVAPMERALDSS